MPKGRLPLAVPKLTPYEIKLGELCALDLWEGIDYVTGKHITRDELFLTNFATPSAQLYSGRKNTLNVSVQDFHHFIIVAGLKSQYQTSNGTDLAKAISAFDSNVVPPYRSWRTKTTTQTPADLVTQAVLDWCPTFVKNPNIGSKDGNYRVSLACRFLFYAFPDFPIFNFSKALQKALILQTRPQDAFLNFNIIMTQGLITNKVLLSKTVMPPPSIIGVSLWKRAEKNGWWKRRVFDLSLLIHFKSITPRVELQREARRLTRPKPKLKKVKPTQSPSAS